MLGHRADCGVFLVTPGNRAAAVVAGLNVIVFSTIAVLAHREKLQKKRAGKLEPTSSPLASPSASPLASRLPSINGDEKRVPLGVKEVNV